MASQNFILAATDLGNLLDHRLYQDSLYFVVIFCFALLGLLVGYFLWKRCKKQCEEIEAENRRLRAEYDRLNRV